jgi:hypothetical protein
VRPGFNHVCVGGFKVPGLGKEKMGKTHVDLHSHKCTPRGGGERKTFPGWQTWDFPGWGREMKLQVPPAKLAEISRDMSMG